MDCSIKSRVNKLLRNDVKERFPYIKEENDTTLSLTPKIGTKLDTKDKVFKAINTEVQKINNKYKIWSKGDVVSVNSALKDVVKINIHPTQSLIDTYEIEEERKIAEETEREALLFSPEQLYSKAMELDEKVIKERIKECA